MQSLSRREFLKGIFAIGAAPILDKLPRISRREPDPTESKIEDELAARVEATKIYEASSWAELLDRIWVTTPQLLEELRELIVKDGPHFQDETFLSKFREERAKKDKNEVRGIIVVRKSDYHNGLKEKIKELYPNCDPSILDLTLTELEHLTFTIPFEKALLESRAMGIDVPSSVHVDIAVVPDEMLDSKIHYSDPNREPTIIPCNFFEDKDKNTLHWPPGIDWIFFDSDPLRYGTREVSQVEGNQKPILVQPKLIHEQAHLLGPMDLYRYLMRLGSSFLDEDNKKTSLSYGDNLKGWGGNKIVEAALSQGDIMFFASSIETSPISALQIALARKQGITSTMYEGSPDIGSNSRGGYKITVSGLNDGEDLTPARLFAYGTVVEAYDDKLFGEQAYVGAKSAKFLPTIGQSTQAMESFMLSVDVTQDDKTFTLPIPEIFFLLTRFRSPTPSNMDDRPYDLKIGVENIFENLAWYRTHGNEEGANLIIDIQIMTESHLKDMRGHQGGDNGVFLATALLEVSQDLFLKGKAQNVFMVWQAKKL